MTKRNAWRGFTQENQNAVIKNDHSRGFLSGIFNACCNKMRKNALLNRYVEDPRLQTLGMTNPNNCHAEESLLSISSALTTQGRDPEQKHLRMTLGNNGAFTLIELLIVVLIIGILAAVALPQYNRAVKKAQGREVLTAIDAIDKAQAAYYLENDNYTDFSDNAIIDIPSLQHFCYVYSDDYRPSGTGCYRSFTRAIEEGSSNHSKKMSVIFRLPTGKVGITARWNQGKLTARVACNGLTGSPMSTECDDYFDCYRTFNGSIWSACYLSK